MMVNTEYVNVDEKARAMRAFLSEPFSSELCLSFSRLESKQMGVTKELAVI